MHLLTAVLAEELSVFALHVRIATASIDEPLLGLTAACDSLVAEMAGSDRVNEALTHAYVAAQFAAADEAERISRLTSDLFASVLDERIPPERKASIGDMMSDAWTAEILALVSGRQTLAAMGEGLRTTITMLDNAWTCTA